jgi:hypothetical protein
MRAREFLREERELPPEISEPLRYTYVLPGLSAADPYKNYRMGVAVARARSDARPDDVNPNRPAWSAETAFGEHAVISGVNDSVDPIIDQALAMTRTPGGKRLVSSAASEEPAATNARSLLKPFRGYPR